MRALMPAQFDVVTRRSAGLSVIVVFFNMRREALRTLYSLSREYQGLRETDQYEVIAIDNGSTEPLELDTVRSFGPEFRYHYVETDNPSPCETINDFTAAARFDNVMIIIDGARILSPGIVRLSLAALEAFTHSFVYTLSMHIGSKPQNFLVAEGYSQSIEDELIESIDWRANGYALFAISSVALSSRSGFYSRLSETNCFAIRKEDFINIGMYQRQFKCPGGGLCNLELFNRLNETEWVKPVMLLGEATFHQFHGGVATNVSMASHPWKSMEKEYVEVVGESYRNTYRKPLYFGFFLEEYVHLYDPIERSA
jgi:hypothetical protein